MHTPLWRAVAVFRIAALIYAAALIVGNISYYQRPALAWPVLAAMAALTVVVSYAYRNPARRRPPLRAADQLLTMAVTAAGAWIVGRPALAAGRPALTVAWLAA